MAMVRLRARREFKYATRRLLPGDDFEATATHAKILIGTRKAQEVRAPVDLPPPPAAVIEAAAPSELAQVRAEYERVMGKRPFHGWSVDELRRRMAAGPDA